MMGDFNRHHIDQTTYRSYESQRDDYRNANYLYPTFVVPKYVKYDGVNLEHQEQARKVLACIASSGVFVYRFMMWLMRKILRVRVFQHALVSGCVVLIFILLTYVYEGDRTEMEKVPGGINSDTNSQHIARKVTQALRVDIKPPLLEAGDTNKQQISRNLTKTLPAVPVYDTAAKCGNTDPCLQGDFAYHVKSGDKKVEKPYICMDGKEVMRPEDMERGMNIVHIKDAANMDKITSQVFDLYAEDSKRLEKFLEGVEDGQVIIVTTYDDAAHQLSDKARKMFMDEFYSKHVYALNYRGQWVFIAQKGRPLDGEHEQVKHFKQAPKVSWGEQAKIQGCVNFNDKPKPKPVKEWLDRPCDVEVPCGIDSIPMHIESGDYHAGKNNLPRICIGDKIVLGNHKIGQEDPASRGLNFVVFNPIDQVIVNIGRFDTYASDSQDREAATFLKSVPDGHLLIGAVYDEASRKLSYETRDIISSFGSAQIYGLEHREMWVFVGQKGVDGMSPFEKVGALEDDKWGAKVDIIDCIPKKISGENIKKARSKKLVKFCDNYIGYPELCNDVNATEGLYPKPLDDPSLSLNEAYNTPIVVIPGTDLHALERCLASVMAVPGIRTNNVLVVLEGTSSFTEPDDLVKLYGFRSQYIKSSSMYSRVLMNGLEQGLAAFPGKEYIIVLEEYLEVTPDFLHYFGQTLHLLDKDSSILTISAWNQNGFTDTSGNQHLLYRTEDFPGFGWVLRRKLFEKEMKDKKSTGCDCHDRPTSRGWFIEDKLRKGRHSIVPDVSRVRRRSKEGFYVEKAFMDAYLNNRKSSSGYLSEPREVYKLVADVYDKELDQLVKDSIAVDQAQLLSCFKDNTLNLQHEPDKGQIYAVYYKPKPSNDTLLHQLAKCFGLFVFDDSQIRGMYKHLLRFTSHGNQYLLISTESPFYANIESQKRELLQVIGLQKKKTVSVKKTKQTDTKSNR